MELVSSLYPPQLPLRKVNHSFYFSSSDNYRRRYHHSYNSYCNATSTTILSVTNNSDSTWPTQIQIQLPLQRPRRRQVRHHPNITPTPPPIIKPPPQKGKTTTMTTTSDILRLMDGLGLPIPIDIYTCLIKECTDTRDATAAVELLGHINRSGLLLPAAAGLLFLNRILLMYVSCSLIDNARHMFNKMPVKDCNSWAAMIAGYMDSDNREEAVNLFIQMQCKYDKLLEFPVSWIIVCILKACVQGMGLRLGKQIHGCLIKVGCDADLYLGSSLINLYGKFGCLEGVDFVFDHMSCRNTVVWTAKLVSNCREERYNEVLNVFKEMGREGVKKNSFTFSGVLRACGRMKDDGQSGQQVHANLIKLGLESNDFVQCGLVDMYAKCGLLKYSERVFEMIGDKRTAACWNAMLTGYIQHGYCIEAIKVLYAMKLAGLQPQESLLNEVRFTCGSKSS